VSLPSSSNETTGTPRRPKADVYTVLLVIALLAILVGILCLCGELGMYNWKHQGGPVVMLDRAETRVTIAFGSLPPLPGVFTGG
jgi:hypothetical protein